MCPAVGGLFRSGKQAIGCWFVDVFGLTWPSLPEFTFLQKKGKPAQPLFVYIPSFCQISRITYLINAMCMCVCFLLFHNTLSTAKLSSSKHQQAYDMCCINRSVQRELAPPEGLQKKKVDIMGSMVDFHSRQYTTKVPNAWNNVQHRSPNTLGMSTYLTNFWKHLSGDVEWFLFVANRDHPSTAHHASYQGSQAFPESKDQIPDHANKVDTKRLKKISTLGIPCISHSSFNQVTSYTRLLSSFGFSECLDIWLKLAHVL